LNLPQERVAAAEDQGSVTQRSRAPPNTLGPWFPSRIEDFHVQRNARPGTPIGRPKVEGLSQDGNAVRWSMMHRYRRGGGFESFHYWSSITSYQFLKVFNFINWISKLPFLCRFCSIMHDNISCSSCCNMY